MCFITQTFLLFVFDHHTPAIQRTEDLRKTAEKKKLKYSLLGFCGQVIYLYSLILLSWKRENTLNEELLYFI